MTRAFGTAPTDLGPSQPMMIQMTDFTDERMLPCSRYELLHKFAIGHKDVARIINGHTVWTVELPIAAVARLADNADNLSATVEDIHLPLFGVGDVDIS